MHISIYVYIIYNVDNTEKWKLNIFLKAFTSLMKILYNSLVDQSISEIIHDREYQLESGAIYKL